MIYDVKIDGEQIGILEEFRNVEWKEGRGNLYIFESVLFSTETWRNDEYVFLNGMQDDMEEICTKTFVKIREAITQSF